MKRQVYWSRIWIMLVLIAAAIPVAYYLAPLGPVSDQVDQVVRALLLAAAGFVIGTQLRPITNAKRRRQGQRTYARHWTWQAALLVPLMLLNGTSLVLGASHLTPVMVAGGPVGLLLGLAWDVWQRRRPTTKPLGH